MPLNLGAVAVMPALDRGALPLSPGRARDGLVPPPDLPVRPGMIELDEAVRDAVHLAVYRGHAACRCLQRKRVERGIDGNYGRKSLDTNTIRGFSDSIYARHSRPVDLIQYVRLSSENLVGGGFLGHSMMR